MYRVVQPFYDLQDGSKEYLPGDTFPRKGLTVSAARLEELATSANRLGSPVIEEVKEHGEQKPTRKRVKKDAD